MPGKLVFHHIPKCGGSTVFQVLQPHWHFTEICPVRSRQLPMIAADLCRYKLFSGHYSPLMAQRYIKGPYKSAFLMRHPIDRIISLYYFCRSHKWSWINGKAVKHPDMSYKTAKHMHFQQFLENGMDRLSNEMLRRICGWDVRKQRSRPVEEMVEQAQKIIDTQIDCLGILPDLRNFVNRLMVMMEIRWDGYLPHALKFSELHKEDHCELIYKEPMTEEIFDLLYDITKGDRLLYDYVVKKTKELQHVY